MQMENFNTARNRWVVRGSNLILACATREYRNFLQMTILYGLRSAARDMDQDLAPPPPIWRSSEDSSAGTEVPVPLMGKRAA